VQQYGVFVCFALEPVYVFSPSACLNKALTLARFASMGAVLPLCLHRGSGTPVEQQLDHLAVAVHGGPS